MKIRLLIFVILLFVSSGCKQESPWNEFCTNEGGFSVLMPSIPVVKIANSDSPIGPLDFHLFILEGENFVYLVGYTDYPDSFVERSSTDSLLNIACLGAVVNLQGKLLQNNKISLEGYPGREIKIEREENRSIYNTRLYLVDNRLYQVTVLKMEGTTLSGDDRRFLDSFKILE